MTLKIARIVDLISRAISESYPTTTLSVYLQGSSNPPSEIGTTSIDDQKTVSALEAMEIRTDSISDVITRVTLNERSKLAAIELAAGDLPRLIESSSETRAIGVHIDPPRFPLLDRSTIQIGCPELHELDYMGRGIKVGILDSGVDRSLGLLNLDKEENFIEDEGLEDKNGHGTHVAGIVGCRKVSAYHGVAPEAILLSAKIFKNEPGPSPDSLIAKGAKWLAENDAQIINASLGGNSSRPSSLADTLEYLSQNGIICVCAAGNSGGSWGTVEDPGCIDAVFTVGSVSKSNQLAYSSSRGPVLGMRVKPDILSPGVYITSLLSSDANGYPDVGEQYITYSGTSMATPHVAGACAIVLQIMEEEGIELDPHERASYIKRGFMSSAKNLSLDPMEQGAGCLDLPAAMNAFVNDHVPDEIIFPSTRAPQRNYGCGDLSHLSQQDVVDLVEIQTHFVLPTGQLGRALISEAGKGSVEALEAANALIPYSILESSIYRIKDALQRVPREYISIKTRDAIGRFLTKEVQKQEAGSRTDNHLPT